jgi:hypothetical protein
MISLLSIRLSASLRITPKSLTALQNIDSFAGRAGGLLGGG